MMLSYAILAHNEYETIKPLLETLNKNKDDEDEIVVVLDESSYLVELKEYLDSLDYVDVYVNPLSDNFAKQKNYLTSKCNGDYIVNIDADEMLEPTLITNLKEIIESNKVDVYFMPRINTLDKDVSPKLAKKWGWNINPKGHINFPDWQMRIYKNSSDIMWKNNVHEKLIGYSDFCKFPTEEVYCIKHHKSFYRQFKQNCYYNYIDIMKVLREKNFYFDVIRKNVKFNTNENDYNFDYFKWEHPYQGNWDVETLFVKEEFSFLEEFIKEGDVVLDIGAQTGNMSVAYSNIVGKEGKVISFEPNPASFSVLEKNSNISKNIDAYNYAVTDDYNVEVFHYSDEGLCNGGFASNTEKGIGVTGHKLPLPVYTIDIVDFMENNYKDLIDEINFIKIDTEGYDRFIIPQLKPFLKNNPTILTEVYDGLTQNEVDDLIKQIKLIGYIPYDEDDYKNGIKKEINDLGDINMKSGHNLLCIKK